MLQQGRFAVLSLQSGCVVELTNAIIYWPLGNHRHTTIPMCSSSMEYPKQILLFSSPILSSVCDTHPDQTHDASRLMHAPRFCQKAVMSSTSAAIFRRQLGQAKSARLGETSSSIPTPSGFSDVLYTLQGINICRKSNSNLRNLRNLVRHRAAFTSFRNPFEGEGKTARCGGGEDGGGCQDGEGGGEGQ